MRSSGVVYGTISSRVKGGARGTRTLMTLRSADFKSAASTIPPSPHKCDILILSRFCLFVNHFDRPFWDSGLADYVESLSFLLLLAFSRCLCFFSLIICAISRVHITIRRTENTGLRGG